MDILWPCFFVIFFAALVQTSAGFAFSIISMMFLPLVFSVQDSMLLVNILNLVVVGYITFKYRKFINFKLIPLPLLFALIGNYIGLSNVVGFENETGIKMIGAALVAFAAFFLLFSNRIRIEANPMTATMSGVASGLMGGFFGMPGPPIVLYYSVAIKEKEAYIATLQCVFLINSIFRIFFFVGHIIPDYRILEILPFAFVAAVIGAFSGNYIFSRVPVSVIQKGVYSLMVLVGFYYIA